MGEEGLDFSRVSQGKQRLQEELAIKLATFDVQGLWKTLEDKERIQVFALLARMAGSEIA